MSKPPQKKWTGLALPTNRPRNSARTRWICTSASQKRWMASRSYSRAATSSANGTDTGTSTGRARMSTRTPSDASASIVSAWKSATEHGRRATVRRSPAVVRTTRSWSRKSNSISSPPGAACMSDVVSPRADTYSGTCHQWFSGGSSARRTLPTIWVHRCTASRVESQPARVRSGQGESAASIAPSCPDGQAMAGYASLFLPPSPSSFGEHTLSSHVNRSPEDPQSHTDPARRPGLAGATDIYRSWPRWARLGAPIAAGILALGLVGSIAGGPEESAAGHLTEDSAERDAPTTTERPRSPATTAAPTTIPPTTAPPTTAPPTTAPPATLPPATVPPTVLPQPVAPAPEPSAPSASYPNCSAAKAAGVTPLHVGDPGYAPHLDRDGDGVACES